VTEKVIAVKIYHQNGEIMVAACDEDLLGQTFEDGELQLQVHNAFYDGFRVDEKGLIQQLGNSTIANLVGEIVVKCALDAGLINDGSIIRIQGIPHAQLYRII